MKNMTMKHIFILFLLACCLSVPSAVQAQATFNTGYFTLALDGKGYVSSLLDRTGHKEYLSSARKAPLLSLRVDGQLLSPARMDWNARRSLLTLHYPEKKAVAEIKVAGKK